MSRPGPVIAPGGRSDRWSSASSLPRVRPSRSPHEPHDGGGWGPHPEAQGHRPPVTPAAAPAVPASPVPASPVPVSPVPVSPVPVSPVPMPPPVAGAVGVLAAAPVPPTPAAVASPALLPALVPRDDRPLGFVERVTAMLRRWNGRPGRHRHGRSRHGWSMFAPQPGARRRAGAWARR